MESQPAPVIVAPKIKTYRSEPPTPERGRNLRLRSGPAPHLPPSSGAVGGHALSGCTHATQRLVPRVTELGTALAPRPRSKEESECAAGEHAGREDGESRRKLAHRRRSRAEADRLGQLVFGG